MGRGDRKTHKGKIFKGSFGNRRMHKKRNGRARPAVTQLPQPASQRT